jgi:HSP20 family protein
MASPPGAREWMWRRQKKRSLSKSICRVSIAKDLVITVENNVLVLRGEKKEEKEEKKKNYHRLERFFGEFYREIPLPIGADTEKIAATSAKGVITITIPKKPEILPKKIAVKPCE